MADLSLRQHLARPRARRVMARSLAVFVEDVGGLQSEDAEWGLAGVPRETAARVAVTPTVAAAAQEKRGG